MTRPEYVKQLIALLRGPKKYPKKTAKALLALNKKATKVARASVSERDAQECLGFAADTLFRSGSLAEAVKIELEMIENYHAEMRYVGHALSNSIARAALICFKLDRIDEGKKMAYEALEFFGRFPEPSYLIEELGAELKKHRQSKPA